MNAPPKTPPREDPRAIRAASRQRVVAFLNDVGLALQDLNSAERALAENQARIKNAGAFVTSLEEQRDAAQLRATRAEEQLRALARLALALVKFEWAHVSARESDDLTWQETVRASAAPEYVRVLDACAEVLPAEELELREEDAEQPSEPPPPPAPRPDPCGAAFELVPGDPQTAQRCELPKGHDGNHDIEIPF